MVIESNPPGFGPAQTPMPKKKTRSEKQLDQVIFQMNKLNEGIAFGHNKVYNKSNYVLNEVINYLDTCDADQLTNTERDDKYLKKCIGRAIGYSNLQTENNFFRYLYNRNPANRELLEPLLNNDVTPQQWKNIAEKINFDKVSEYPTAQNPNLGNIAQQASPADKLSFEKQTETIIKSQQPQTITQNENNVRNLPTNKNETSQQENTLSFLELGASYRKAYWSNLQRELAHDNTDTHKKNLEAYSEIRDKYFDIIKANVSTETWKRINTLRNNVNNIQEEYIKEMCKKVFFKVFCF